MDFQILFTARTAYSYPPGFVERTNEQEPIEISNLNFQVPSLNGTNFFSNSIELDKYHTALLNSGSTDSTHLGIASVQYWGRCFAKARLNHNQAVARVHWLFEGNARSKKTLINCAAEKSVIAAVKSVSEDKFGDAYMQIEGVPHLGTSFGSKLLAFICPEKIGIYDSHIARYLSDNIESIKALVDWDDKNDVLLPYPKRFSVSNSLPFQNYCLLLSSLAQSLNQKGKDYQWKDWDGSAQQWRAVDVERALFQIAHKESQNRGKK